MIKLFFEKERVILKQEMHLKKSCLSHELFVTLSLSKEFESANKLFLTHRKRLSDSQKEFVYTVKLFR